MNLKALFQIKKDPGIKANNNQKVKNLTEFEPLMKIKIIKTMIKK
jgi:hypothetical protein